MDTIFAPATAQGRSGVAIVRISGDGALGAAEVLCGPLPQDGRSLRKLKDRHGALIDEALVLCFDKGASFTGEPTVELQCHGSPAVLALILSELANLVGVRLAEAGEFTRRALENGRLDLAQVEGLADLIDAETEAQRRQAVRVFSGALGRRADHWRSSLIRAMALVEATIDFADEEVPVDVSPEVLALIQMVRSEIEAELAGAHVAERIRTGFEVAIVGPPNVGKSTLLNVLAGREAAITSETAGTTRDVIEVRMDLNGYAVTLLDTAGIREAQDVVETIGIERGMSRAALADLRVHMVPVGGASGIGMMDGDIVLIAKDDAGIHAADGISPATGHGVAELIERLANRFDMLGSTAGVAVRQRHVDAMTSAVAGLAIVEDRLDQIEELPDILAEHLRKAVRSMDVIVGRVGTEDVLGEIFSSFCIGK